MDPVLNAPVDIVGFISLGDINDQLLELERDCQNDKEHSPIAKHVLVLMVRGVFFELEFPYAYFRTGVTGDLFPIILEGIRQLEGIGLKGIFVMVDGSSPNRYMHLSYCKGNAKLLG